MTTEHRLGLPRRLLGMRTTSRGRSRIASPEKIKKRQLLASVHCLTDCFEVEQAICRSCLGKSMFLRLCSKSFGSTTSSHAIPKSSDLPEMAELSRRNTVCCRPLMQVNRQIFVHLLDLFRMRNGLPGKPQTPARALHMCVPSVLWRGRSFHATLDHR